MALTVDFTYVINDFFFQAFVCVESTPTSAVLVPLAGGASQGPIVLSSDDDSAFIVMEFDDTNIEKGFNHGAWFELAGARYMVYDTLRLGGPGPYTQFWVFALPERGTFVDMAFIEVTQPFSNTNVVLVSPPQPPAGEAP